MSTPSGKVTVSLSAPVVLALLDELPEEQRLEILQGTLSNVVRAYLSTMAKAEVEAIQSAIYNTTLDLAKETFGEAFGIEQRREWSTKKWYAVLPPSMKSTISVAIGCQVAQEVNCLVEQAVTLRLAALDERIIMQTENTIKKRMIQIVEATVAKFDRSLIAHLKAIVTRHPSTTEGEPTR